MKKVLTIAGSDSTGGAGIEADLKTFQEYGVFGFASIASIVTMDPSMGWTHEVTAMDTSLVEKQLISAFTWEPMDRTYFAAKECGCIDRILAAFGGCGDT